MITFVIVHFNTPELTTCLCGSIRKFHTDAKIIIFDNSDKRPFDAELCDLYYDNTAGQIIDFNKELEKYPDRNIEMQARTGCNFGSAKHTMSIDWLCKNIKEEFVLLDSDILLKRSVDFIDNNFICVSDIIRIKPDLIRICPMLAYINPIKMNENHINFFDGTRMHGLCKESSKYLYYDTGTSFLEDISKIKQFKQINTDDYYLHYGNGSWRNGDKIACSPDNKHADMSAKEWLIRNKIYWM